MNKKIELLFYGGGLLMAVTAIAFLYVVLFKNETTFMQWSAALMIFGLGCAAMAIGWGDEG